MLLLLTNIAPLSLLIAEIERYKSPNIRTLRRIVELENFGTEKGFKSSSA